RDQLRISSVSRKLSEQAGMASQRGLPAKALQLLLDAAPSEIKLDEARLELELLLMTGRLFLFQKAFTPEVREKLGDAGDTLALWSLAASGAYEEADKVLGEIIARSVRRGDPAREQPGVDGEVAQIFGQAVLETALPNPSPAYWLFNAFRLHVVTFPRVAQLVQTIQQGADLEVLR